MCDSFSEAEHWWQQEQKAVGRATVIGGPLKHHLWPWARLHTAELVKWRVMAGDLVPHIIHKAKWQGKYECLCSWVNDFQMEFINVNKLNWEKHFPGIIQFICLIFVLCSTHVSTFWYYNYNCFCAIMHLITRLLKIKSV